MKKILALLLAVMMLLTLTACKSKEQKAADKYLKDLEKLMDEVIEAAEDKDVDKLMELLEEGEEMDAEFQDIYDDLADVDEDAAEDFEKEYKELCDKAEEALEDIPVY